jgi:hypothetical protein
MPVFPDQLRQPTFPVFLPKLVDALNDAVRIGDKQVARLALYGLLSYFESGKTPTTVPPAFNRRTFPPLKYSGGLCPALQ